MKNSLTIQLFLVKISIISASEGYGKIHVNYKNGFCDSY